MTITHMSVVKGIAWRVLYAIQRLCPRRHPRLTVLLYHSISAADDFFTVSPERFREQMAYVHARYDVVGAWEVAAFLRGAPLARDAVMITFDDGYQDIANTATPILREFGITATVFVLAGEADRGELGSTLSLVPLTETKGLVANGMMLGSHGCTHRKLTRLPEQEARRELEESRARIGAHAAVPISFAYPKGAYNTRVAALVCEAGYELAFTAEARAVRRTDSPYAVPRVQIDATTDLATFKAKLSPAQDWYHALWMLVMRTT